MTVKGMYSVMWIDMHFESSPPGAGLTHITVSERGMRIPDISTENTAECSCSSTVSNTATFTGQGPLQDVVGSSVLVSVGRLHNNPALICVRQSNHRQKRDVSIQWYRYRITRSYAIPWYTVCSMPLSVLSRLDKVYSCIFHLHLIWLLCIYLSRGWDAGNCQAARVTSWYFINFLINFFKKKRHLISPFSVVLLRKLTWLLPPQMAAICREGKNRYMTFERESPHFRACGSSAPLNRLWIRHRQLLRHANCSSERQTRAFPNVPVMSR